MTKKIKRKKCHNKNYYIKLFCLIVAVLSLLTFFLGTWFNGDNSTLKYINSIDYEYVSNQNIQISKYPQQNYVEINNKTGRNLKIMQLTDIHIGCGFLSINLDKKVVNEIFKAVDRVDPDIIIITGDALSAIYTTTGTRNSYLQLDALISLFEKLNRPYTFCFGNHDGAGTASKEYIAKKLEQAPNSFFLRGEESVEGEGNDYVKILTDGILTSSLVLMDSGARAKDGNYAGVSKNQVEWYEKTIKILKNEKSDIKNLMFLHVPIPEYDLFYNEYSSGNENYELVLGGKFERVCAGKQNGLYNKIKELDSTKWVYCGHDHTNNFSIVEKSSGIMLSYGMSMDYSTYPFIKFQSKSRGARLIEIESDGNVKNSLAKQTDGYKIDA